MFREVRMLFGRPYQTMLASCAQRLGQCQVRPHDYRACIIAHAPAAAVQQALHLT